MALTVSLLGVALALAGGLGAFGVLRFRDASTAGEGDARDREAQARLVAEQARQAAEQARTAARRSPQVTWRRPTRRRVVRREELKIRDTVKDRDAAFHREEKLKKDKDKAESKLKEETTARDNAEPLLYTQLVAQSHRAWRDHDTDDAMSLLEAGRPKDKRPDLRGWEWHDLQRLIGHPRRSPIVPTRTKPGSAPARHAQRRWDRPPFLRPACAPDNAVIALALFDNRVTLWNTVFGTVLAKLEGHTGVVTGVAFSNDGAQVATAAAPTAPPHCGRAYGSGAAHAAGTRRCRARRRL